MRHLLVGQEYPPMGAGGIGTYAGRIAALLAAGGETVHVLTRARPGATAARETSADGRLTIHRIDVDAPLQDARQRRIEAALIRRYRPHGFAWRAAPVIEHLVQSEQIDIIEAPEFEAPLYVFQLRRQAGLGPAVRPPVIVHLHGASDVVFRHDDFDAGDPYTVAAQCSEAFSIAAAKALVCPSAFYAARAADLFGVAPGSMRVIRYPLGTLRPLERSGAVWTGGGILFVGRLERRKGVLDWIAAAVRLARDDAALRFDFAGPPGRLDEWGGLDAMRAALIPQDVRAQFRFHGEQPEAGLLMLLQNARLAVFPSHWDNLPNAALEAMAAGLPVLVTSSSGMMEVVEHGRSGWIVAAGSVDALEHAARAALALDPAVLAGMGEAASRRVFACCGDGVVLAAHLDHRRAVLQAAAPAGPDRTGPPLLVRLTGVGAADVALVEAARGAAVRSGAAGIVLLAAEDDPAPGLADILARAFATTAVGIVTVWVETDAGLRTALAPTVPNALLALESNGPIAIRTAAVVVPAVAARAQTAAELRWALVLASLDAGWPAIVVPEVLARVRMTAPVPYHRMQAFRRELHDAYAPLLAAHAVRTVELASSPFGIVTRPAIIAPRLARMLLLRLAPALVPLAMAAATRFGRRVMRRLRRLVP